MISPAYKHLGLQHLLENYNFEPFNLLTNFHFGDAHCLKGHELDVNKHDKFGSNSYVNDIFDKAPLRLLYSSSHPLTEYKMEWHANLVKERALLEDAFEKLEKPCVMQTKYDDLPQIFLSGNMPVDQMILREYSFSVFQVPHHRQRPKLAIEVRSCFPSEELIENAAKLMALYNYRHILGAEINLLDDKHSLYETSKSFNSYFMKKESGFENKFEKGFVKMFITHTRLPNDPDDCYVMENPQILWYEKSGSEVFSDKTIKAIEEERRRQLGQIFFLCECIEWAYYYKEISAEVYTVSAGDDYNKIALQAIIGIMIACKWRNLPCRFAFTNSGWLKHMGGLMPRIVREYFTDNTEIWFLNNASSTNGRLKAKPFITVDLCNISNSENGDNVDIDNGQKPMIKINTSSKTVQVTGLNSFKLEDIRNEEDHRNIESRVSASLKVVISRQPLKHSNRSTDRCLLTDYLKHIGYPNPSKPVRIRKVMECVLGDLLVSQIMNLEKEQSEYFEIIPELLNCKTKGTSEFVLNFTKTASHSANVIVYIPNTSSLKLSNTKLLNACFEVNNAKTLNLKVTLHLTLAKKPVSLDLVKYLNPVGSIGITLAEHIANYNYTGTVWKPAKCLIVGEVLHVLFKEDYVISVLKSIPLFLSAKVSRCRIQHYFSYIKLDDENRIAEVHIYMQSPGMVGNENICLDIKLISLHLYPLCMVNENGVQVRGKGLINGCKVEFNSCLSSYSSQDLDVKFCDLFTTEKIFDIINLRANSDSIIKQHEDINSNPHLIFSQIIPDSMASEVTCLTFGDDFETLKCSLPSVLSDAADGSSYLALHYPFRNDISNPIVGKWANFTFNPLQTSGALPEGKAFSCSVHTESNEKHIVDILPFYGCQSCLNVREIIESLCCEMGTKLVEKMVQIQPIEQCLHKMALCKLSLGFVNLKVDSVDLDLSVERCELLSTPCLTLHNASVKVIYSTLGEFTFQYQGNLTLQLYDMHDKLHTYNFKGEFILPTGLSKGVLHFDNHNNFTLENLMEAFGYAPGKVKSIPILSSVLATSVRNVHIEFSSLSSLQVSSLCAMLYLQELDIGIIKLNHIQLEVKIVRQENDECEFKIHYKLQALMSEKLFVELEYDPDNHTLHGSVTVCDFKAVVATDGLMAVFNDSDPCSQSFSNMKMIIQDCFMSVFQSSENNQKEGAGLIGCMKLSIHVPSKTHKMFSLEHIVLQVKDCLCIRNCVFDTIEFNYSKTSPSSSEAHLMAVLRVKSSKESMKITFDLTNTSDKPKVLSATIEPNGTNSSISLHSIFGLVSCIEPGLPKVDLPPIFELLLVHGSVSLTLSPFQVCKCDVAVIIPKWQIFDDPDFKVQDIKIRTIWESGMTMPSLIFDNCTLVFQNWKLNISGKIMPNVVTIKCASDLFPPDTIQFKSFLKDYTPKSIACPTVPTDVELPPLPVSTIQLGVELEENTKTFSLSCTISNVWEFHFGDHLVQVKKISGSLEWTKQNNSASSYRAVLYGLFELDSISVSASMHLGNNIDSILVATISNVHYDQIAYGLTFQPFDSSFVPQNVQKINSYTACLAFNVTKKHFFLSGSVEKWGECTLLVGYLHDQNDIDYMVMISIGDDFRFFRLSDSLAFVDDYVTVRCANLLVTSVNLDTLKSVMKPFEEASSNIQNPFITLPKLDSSKLVNNEVKRGTTLYAVLNIHSCGGSKGTIGNLFQLGDQSLAQNDIIVKVYVDNFSDFVSNLEVFAYIPVIHLFGMLEFSMIEMSYQITQKDKDASPDYSLVLTGRVTFGLDLDTNYNQSICFDGKLHVTTTDACFEASQSSKNAIDKPGGINVRVEELKLKLKFELNENKSKVPDVMIYGRVAIGLFILESMLILKGTCFKVFEIKLKNGLTLNALFKCSDVNWSASSLTIHIKDGKFYYAKEDISIEGPDQKIIHYKQGLCASCIIDLFDWDFRIEAHVPPGDRTKLSLSGRSVKKIDLGLAKLTGTGNYIHEGPEIRYYDNRLSLNVGVELFNQPFFEGSLSYLFNEKALEGSICYLGRILWIENPRLTVRWSEKEGFQIIEFPMLGSPFDLLGAIAKYAIMLYKLISGIFKWGIELKLRTGKNPDPDRYLVKLILGGSITVTIAGFITAEVIPLPEIPLRIVKMKDFTLSKLPQFILKCLWESAGDICKSILRYINPVTLAWRMGKMIVGAVITIIKTVVNVVKNVAKKAWGFCKRIFGWSAFLVDATERTVLGYVYAGKDGKKLQNIRYTVDNFGEFLVAHTIEKIAKDVHTNATACMQVEGKNDYSSDLSRLQEVTHSLSSELNLAADEVLAIKNITADYYNDVVCIRWQVGDSEGKIYSEDRGDIEYHVKVIVIMTQVEAQMVSVHIKKIYDDMLIPVYPSSQAKIQVESKDQDAIEEVSEVVEKESSCEEEQSLLESSSDSQSNQLQDEQRCVEESVQDETSSTADEEEMHHTQSAEDAVEIEPEMLSANISIDHAILEQALCIYVSVKPTVTLSIKTFPPEKDPRVIDEESLQSEDKEWMRNIKDEINKSGREKEVTLIGKTGYYRHIMKSASANSELTINANFMYSDETKILTAKGIIKAMPEASYYLIQVIDTSDETTVIKSEVITPTSPYIVDTDPSTDHDKDGDGQNIDINDNNAVGDNVNDNNIDHDDDHGDEDIDDHDDDHDDDNDVDVDDDDNDVDDDDDNDVNDHDDDQRHGSDDDYVTGSDDDYVTGSDDNDSASDHSSENHSNDDIENQGAFDDSIGFSCDITLQEIPDDSHGPYSITGYALTETLECLHINKVPDTIVHRCKPPTNAEAKLPFSNENSEVELKWQPGSDEDEHLFEIKISITCTKQNSEMKDIENNFLLEKTEQTFTHLIPSITINKQTDTEDTNKVYYTYKFDLVALFNKNGISLQTGVVVKCEIFGVSKQSTSLPSLPAVKEFIVVASPPKVTICLNELVRINPGLKLSWIHTMHAVSYQIEIIDKATKKNKHDKTLQFDKNTTKDFSADSILNLDDLKALVCEDGPKHYYLQMSAQGLGHDLIRSLAPAVAQEEVVISSIDIKYISAKESILVKFVTFTPLRKVTYEVALCQSDTVHSLLSKQTVQVDSIYNSTVYCEFKSHLWKHCMKAGYGVSAYAYARGVNRTFYLGVSSCNLLFLPPPQSINTEVHYSTSWLVDYVDIKWPSATHADCYQFGFEPVQHSSSIAYSRRDFGSQAKIYNTELHSVKMSSAICKCFVKSVGCGYKMTSNPVTDDTVYYQFITRSDGTMLTFTSVSLLAMQNLCINLTKISCFPSFRQRVFPKGHPFPREYFSARIFKKFWEDYCYDSQGALVIMRKWMCLIFYYFRLLFCNF